MASGRHLCASPAACERFVCFGRQSANEKDALWPQSPDWFITSDQSRSDRITPTCRVRSRWWDGSERVNSRRSHLCLSREMGHLVPPRCVWVHIVLTSNSSRLFSRRLLWHCHGRRPRGAFPGLQVRRSASPPQQIRGWEEEVGAPSVFAGSQGNLMEGRGAGGNRLVLTQEFNLWINDCDSQICPWPGSALPVFYSHLWQGGSGAGPVCSFFFFFSNYSRFTHHWNSCQLVIAFETLFELECFGAVIKDRSFFLPKVWLPLPLAATKPCNNRSLFGFLGMRQSLHCCCSKIALAEAVFSFLFACLFRRRSFSSGFWLYFLYWFVTSTCGPVFSCACLHNRNRNHQPSVVVNVDIVDVGEHRC